jgi:4-hydroxy-2-oxoheptanedioate aldolase
MIEVIESIIGRVRALGKAVGTLAADPAVARRCVELGCSFVAVGTDVALLSVGASDLARLAGAGAKPLAATDIEKAT